METQNREATKISTMQSLLGLLKRLIKIMALALQANREPPPV